jgi:hypothetical protein
MARTARSTDRRITPEIDRLLPGSGSGPLGSADRGGAGGGSSAALTSVLTTSISRFPRISISRCAEFGDAPLGLG